MTATLEINRCYFCSEDMMLHEFPVNTRNEKYFQCVCGACQGCGPVCSSALEAIYKYNNASFVERIQKSSPQAPNIHPKV